MKEGLAVSGVNFKCMQCQTLKALNGNARGLAVTAKRRWRQSKKCSHSPFSMLDLGRFYSKEACLVVTGTYLQSSISVEVFYKDAHVLVTTVIDGSSFVVFSIHSLSL